MNLKSIGTAVLFLLLIFQLTAAQDYSPSALDAQLAQIAANCKALETKIKQLIGTQSTAIQTFMASITNVADITNALTAMLNLYNMQLTADNFPPTDQIQTCDDVNLKVTTINYDIQMLYNLASYAQRNATAVLQQNSWITYHCAVNIAKIGTSNYVNCINTVNMITRLVTEYLLYANQLLVAAVTEYGLKTQLNIFKQKYCACPTSLSLAASSNVSTMDTNIAAMEKPLLEHQKLLISKASTALGFVQAGIPASLSTYLTVPQTLAFLRNLATISDYGKETWSNTTTCTALLTRIGYITYKYQVTALIYSSAAVNYSYSVAYQNNLNVTVRINNSSFTAAQYTSIVNGIKALMELQQLFLDYMNRLSWTLNRLAHALIDIAALGDTFCSCNGTGSTTLSTTVSTSTSTSTSTTSGAPTTTEPYSMCQFKYRIVTRPAEEYLKSVCFIPTPMNHADAAAYCNSFGMTLFGLADDLSYQIFQFIVNSIWPSGTQTFLGNGITTGDKKWKIYTNQTKALYNGVTIGPEEKSGNACLKYEGSASTDYVGTAVDCDTFKAPFFCEYYSDVF